MEEETSDIEIPEKESKGSEVVYNSEKDFYRGMSGELRFKAEGLFKKAKEKGISIEEIDIETLRESQADFPGIGVVDLPAFVIKIKGRHLNSGQLMMDGKQIDYFNIYQKYMAEKIERKNWVKDEHGRIARENNRPKVKDETELSLSEWEKFEIGKRLVEDKEFGMEKTITGACDRVIRKLMGENDWLSPGEARMLDEEFNSVQEKIRTQKERAKTVPAGEGAANIAPKRATDRQINYLKARIKNSGVDPDNDEIMQEILRQSGFETSDVSQLSTGDMSKIIDSVNMLIPKVKEYLSKKNTRGGAAERRPTEPGNTIRQ